MVIRLNPGRVPNYLLLTVLNISQNVLITVCVLFIFFLGITYYLSRPTDFVYVKYAGHNLKESHHRHVFFLILDL
jgi:hypothetical protein